MALSQKLLIRQRKALVMPPQLMQAIKRLQLSNLDLTAYVENELERNPLLERSAAGDEPHADETPGGTESAAAGEASGEAQSGDWAGEELETSRASMESNLDTGLENVFPDDTAAPAERLRTEAPAAYSEWSGVGAGGRDGSEYNLEAFVTAETTLASHLADQLMLAVQDPVRRMIGQHLIDLVDEAGYLAGDLASIAEKLGAPLAEVEAVLPGLPSFGPARAAAGN